MAEARSVTELFTDALKQFSDLIRHEIQLARAELAQKASQAIMGVSLLLGGALLLIPSLVLLLMALAAWFENLGLATPLADLFAGLVGLGVGAVAGWVGISRLSPQNLTPSRTLAQLRRDAAAAKEQV